MICAGVLAALAMAQPVWAAPPDPVTPAIPAQTPAQNPAQTMDSDIAAQNGTSAAGPGFDPDSPPTAFAQPRRDAPLDPVVAQLIVTRLIALHLLSGAHDAQDPAKAAAAVRNFQAGIGIKPTGVLDRKTIALMAL